MKYQRCTTSGFNDIRIGRFEFIYLSNFCLSIAYTTNSSVSSSSVYLSSVSLNITFRRLTFSKLIKYYSDQLFTPLPPHFSNMKTTAGISIFLKNHSSSSLQNVSGMWKFSSSLIGKKNYFKKAEKLANFIYIVEKQQLYCSNSKLCL